MVMRARTGVPRKDFMQLLIDLKEKGQLSPEEEETGERNNYIDEPSEDDNSKLLNALINEPNGSITLINYIH